MKSRNPSLLSNSGLPRRAAALPKRPNFMIPRFYCWTASLETTTPAGRHNPRSTALVTQATCTLLLASPAPSPLNLYGEHHYALPIGGGLPDTRFRSAARPQAPRRRSHLQ